MKDNFVPSELQAKASESLEEGVKHDLEKEDPSSQEDAQRTIAKNLETSSKNEQPEQGYGNRFKRW